VYEYLSNACRVINLANWNCVSCGGGAEFHPQWKRTKRLADANRSHVSIRVTENVGHGRGVYIYSRTCKKLSSPLVWSPCNIRFAVCYTVRAEVYEVQKNLQALKPRALWRGSYLTPRNTALPTCVTMPNAPDQTMSKRMHIGKLFYHIIGRIFANFSESWITWPLRLEYLNYYIAPLYPRTPNP